MRFEPVGWGASLDPHGVTIAEEAETLRDRGLVGLEDQFATDDFVGGGESADQHEERGAWEVEIREQSVDQMELRGGHEKKVGGARAGDELAFMGARDAFENSKGGGADGDDAVPVATGPLDRFRRGGWYLIRFGVHDVIGRIFGLDRGECPDSDVQGDFGDANTGISELLEQFDRKVQSGGGRGVGAGFPGIDRLVAFAVFREGLGTTDVRRQWHDAVQMGERENVGPGWEDEPALTIVALFDHLGGQLGGSGGAKKQSRTRANAFSGAQEDPPPPCRGRVEKQDFHGAPPVGLSAEESGGYHAGIIQDQKIAGTEEVGEVQKKAGLETPRGTLDPH